MLLRGLPTVPLPRTVDLPELKERATCTETSEGFDEEREWVRSFWSALEPWHQGVYMNFLGDEGSDRVRQSYGAKKYDPDNFFRINQNISPT